MENEASSPVYSFTKEHESITPFIHTSAGACPPDELEAVESLSADDSRIRWKKALWDTGATQSCISDRLATEFGLEDDCDLIIGMDIMTQGDLAMTNLEGRTVFSFRIPSLYTVDFEAEHTA